MAISHLELCGETYEIVTVDFETFYDTKEDYSLSKLSMSEYIRDPRFQTIGASIKVGDGPTNWYQGYEIVQTVLDTIDWSKSALLAQNTCFDGLILNEQYGVIPTFYLDTKHMGSALLPKGFKLGLDPMARMFGLAGKVHGDALKSADGWHYEDFTEDMLYNMGVYCNEDVEMTAALFEQFYPAIPDDELELIDLTLRMYCMPTFVVDRDKVRAELEREIAAKDAAVAKTNLQLVTLMSNVQFAAHLKSLGVDPPMKLNKKGVETFAFAKTDEEFTNLKEHPNEEVANAVLARLMVKSTINETRAKRFLAVTEHKTTMPACLKYSAAISHRWSGADRINLQNLRRKGPLRKALLAPEGCVVVVRDSSQIEARTLAWWAGQLDLVKAFRDGEKVYEAMASDIFGQPVEAIGKDSDERFVGKVCFGPDTRVLTSRGIKRIVDVTSSDMLWDGTQWVTHSGLIYQGIKETWSHLGVAATPDHEILTARGWAEWQEVLTDPSLFLSALSLGTLPSSGGSLTPRKQEEHGDTVPYVAVPVELKHQCVATTSKLVGLLDVTNARKSPPVPNDTGATRRPWQTMGIAHDCLIGYRPPSIAAIIPTTLSSAIMGDVVSRFVQNGVQTVQRFYVMCKRFLAGMSLNGKWIEQTIMPVTLQVTSDSRPAKKTRAISEASTFSSVESPSLKQRLPTYDLANAGPNHRFTVITDAGPVVVSNCILGLGYGMGVTKFGNTLSSGAMGRKVPLEEHLVEKTVRVYRARNSYITRSWREAAGVLDRMASGLNGNFNGIEYTGTTMRLPNGLFIQYPNLRLTPKLVEGTYEYEEYEMTYQGRGKSRKRIYGPLLVENLIQALARCVIGYQMLLCKRAGYRPVMTTHDEIVVVVRKELADKALEDLGYIMRQVPTWGEGIPIDSEGGYDFCYSK